MCEVQKTAILSEGIYCVCSILHNFEVYLRLLFTLPEDGFRPTD